MSQEVDLRFTPEQRQIIEQARGKLEYVQKGSEFIELKRLECFFLDEFFNETELGYSKATIRNEKSLYSWFENEGFRKEIGLNASQSKTLETKTEKLKELSLKTISSFRATGDRQWLESFQVELDQFEADVEKALSADQFERLKSVLIRNEILAVGLPEYLKANGEKFGLTDGEISEINAEAKKISMELCRKANLDFIAEINKLLPDYLDSFSEQQASRLPLLPLQAFLGVAQNSEQLERFVSHSVNGYEIDIANGEWIFQGPIFQHRRTGAIEVSSLTNKPSVPSSSLRIIREQIGEQWTDEQLAALIEIMKEMNSDAAGSLAGRERFDANQKVVASLKSIFLPIQWRPISNYVRLHSVFTLGPDFIRGKLKTRISGRDWEERLKKTNSRVSEIIENKTSEFAKLFVDLINARILKEQKDKELVEVFKVEYLCSRELPAYEKLFRPVLKTKDSSNGR